jgi:enterochelin esterase-like enzyme
MSKNNPVFASAAFAARRQRLQSELIKINRQFKSLLKDKGVQFADLETPGMHTWMVWRRNLVALAPQLFR